MKPASIRDSSQLEGLCWFKETARFPLQVVAQLEGEPRMFRSDFAKKDRIPVIYKYSKLSMLAKNLQKIFLKVSPELDKTHAQAPFSQQVSMGTSEFSHRGSCLWFALSLYPSFFLWHHKALCLSCSVVLNYSITGWLLYWFSLHYTTSLKTETASRWPL